MSIRPAEGSIDDRIPINNVLVSVSDKTGLDMLIPTLITINPSINLMSTGGTYDTIKEFLEKQGYNPEKNLIKVEDYTDFPEMDGGLVKTLHPLIHAGILGERNNPKHQGYIRNLSKKMEFDDPNIKRLFDAKLGERYGVEIVEGLQAVYIDLVVGNLYPFEEMVEKIRKGVINTKTDKPYNFEDARGNIDIGGPTMLRGAAKNFLGCAVLCDPNDYQGFVNQVSVDGCTTKNQRLELMPKVFRMTGNYDTKIGEYMTEQAKNPDAVRAHYNIVPGGR